MNFVISNFKGNKHSELNVYCLFGTHATLLESSLSITTPSFVDIMVFNLINELDKLLICLSKCISKYAATAIGNLFDLKVKP